MVGENDAALLAHFRELRDPRVERTRAHPLINILVIAICAIICGADDWVAVAAYGQAKQAWLGRFLDLRNGIPSHDTFGRVFSLLDPAALQSCFVRWIKAVARLSDGEIVAIDGKKLNGSADAPKGHAAIHMVSAWACANRLVLGQVRVDHKTNELKAIPRLLELLDLTGCIVTLDAAGTYAEIAQALHARGAGYVLPLKENQPTLREAVAEHFTLLGAGNAEQDAEQDAKQAASEQPLYAHLRTVDKAHGRIEIREHYVAAAGEWLATVSGKELWPGLRTVGMVCTQRRVGDKQSSETRYYLTTLAVDAVKFAAAVRSHWCIENQLHWILDVAFDEDHNRTRTGHAAHNLAVLHHIALNLVKQETTAKLGVKNRRLQAAWDDAYLAQILFS